MIQFHKKIFSRSEKNSHHQILKQLIEQNIEINVFGPKNKVRNCYMSVEKINVTMNN